MAPWVRGDAPGLKVHRNTSLKGAVDALESNFPAVAQLVGEEWFRAAAREFAVDSPPRTAALHAYGETLADWLAAFPPAEALPYLPAVARLDLLWLEAFFAADTDPLAAGALASLDAEGLERTALRLHPAVRLAWLGDNSPDLWLQARWPAEPAPDLEFVREPQGIAISRPYDAVRARIIGADEFAFLDACRRGRPLAEAARLALDAPGEAGLPAIIAAALEDGMFIALEPFA